VTCWLKPGTPLVLGRPSCSPGLVCFGDEAVGWRRLQFRCQGRACVAAGRSSSLPELAQAHTSTHQRSWSREGSMWLWPWSPLSRFGPSPAQRGLQPGTDVLPWGKPAQAACPAGSHEGGGQGRRQCRRLARSQHFSIFLLVKPREAFLLRSAELRQAQEKCRGETGPQPVPALLFPSPFQVPVTLSFSSSPGGPCPSHRGFIVLSASS